MLFMLDELNHILLSRVANHLEMYSQPTETTMAAHFSKTAVGEGLSPNTK